MTTAEFAGTSIIVTGAGTGIGQATARAFAARGADVLAVGRTEARLAETAEGLPGVRPLAADIRTPGAAEHIVAAAVEAYGHLDVLVNNAGVVRQAPPGDVDADAVEDMLATNLLAPVHLMGAALPYLAERGGGAVINVTTAIGQRGWPWPGGELYAAAKAALDSLTRSWAVQFAARGVRVNAVAPGPIATPMAANQGLDEERRTALRESLIARLPQHRIGEPDEVAFWIVQLARPEAAFTTGVVLPVDGGALAG